METNVNTEESQYIQLIQTILDKGSLEKTRNGEVLSLFGYSMRFSLSNGKIPLLTTKKVAWKTCFKELIWFLSGKTDNKILRDENVNIWDANASREFLDERGLINLEENDLGPVYGHQWRHFNAPYENCHTDYLGKGIDQLNNIIQDLKNPETRSSRRLVLSAWNPCQIEQMALPPCHVLAQFNVREGKYLSCALYQRSGDVGLGVPFNIASYSFLTHILAKHCDLIAEDFVYFLGNAHIYKNHIEPLKTQIEREPYIFPAIEIVNKREHIEEYKVDDIHWKTSYTFHPTIKMNMIA
jgi:thymidylate synthase